MQILRGKEDFLSGEEISRQLDSSRQSLWKHIQELKGKGYEIEAVPHLGYRLVSAPDRLYPEEVSFGLGTEFVGRTLYYHERVPSTMDAAMELGAAGCPDGTAVIAEAQSAGRGRLGRSWSSPKHKGIYCSLVLRPEIPPGQAPVLALLAAVAVCEAVENVSGVRCGIKWPNDILLHNRKLGGILTELRAELDRTSYCVIGIGLNVNNAADELVAGAVSLKEAAGGPVERAALLREIFSRAEAHYSVFLKKGGGRVLDEWRGRSVTLGSRVKVDAKGRHAEGVAVDIDSDGGLMVRDDSGIVRKFTAGDVVHVR